MNTHTSAKSDMHFRRWIFEGLMQPPNNRGRYHVDRNGRPVRAMYDTFNAMIDEGLVYYDTNLGQYLMSDEGKQVAVTVLEKYNQEKEAERIQEEARKVARAAEWEKFRAERESCRQEQGCPCFKCNNGYSPEEWGM